MSPRRSSPVTKRDLARAKEGYCDYCRWHGLIIKYKGRYLCVKTPNRCFETRHTLPEGHAESLPPPKRRGKR